MLGRSRRGGGGWRQGWAAKGELRASARQFRRRFSDGLALRVAVEGYPADKWRRLGMSVPDFWDITGRKRGSFEAKLPGPGENRTDPLGIEPRSAAGIAQELHQSAQPALLDQASQNRCPLRQDVEQVGQAH